MLQIDGRRYVLKRPPPPNRTVEQLWNHFVVERAIADRIKGSDPSARKEIYAGMYGELFSKVPDHPRLTRRSSDSMTGLANRSRLGLLKRWLGADKVVAEFACGDARFSMEELAPRVLHVYGIDISDQRGEGVKAPDNFSMITYDGFSLSGVPNESLDMVFSDQFLEHLHPDEVRNHFEIVWRILKPGGVYVIRTPHALSGPHDISAYFSDEPEGFHLHEWRFTELRDLILSTRFVDVAAFWNKRELCVAVPSLVMNIIERGLSIPRKGTVRTLSRFLMPTLVCAARK